MTLVLSIAWLAIVIWLISRAFRQGRALNRLDPKPGTPADARTSIAIIVPARDEADNIQACLETLLSQTVAAEDVHIIVVDDESTDATAALVAEVRERHRRVDLIRALKLPSGWTGKSHACWLATCGATAEWLCFVDADVRVQDTILATALADARARALDFLSLTPRQELVSFAERLVMPCGLYLLAFVQDLATMQTPTSDEATATGQFMLVRRSAYEAVGGHAAVRGAISEDVALARLLKRSGFRVSIAGGDLLLRTRMYTGWRTLWIGVSKNIVDMLGGPAQTLLVACCGVILAWAAVVLPIVDAIGCAGSAAHACLALAIATTGSAAAFGLHVSGSLFFRIPFWYGLIFPVGYTAGALMALDSLRRRATGRTRWKGRTYP